MNKFLTGRLKVDARFLSSPKIMLQYGCIFSERDVKIIMKVHVDKQKLKKWSGPFSLALVIALFVRFFGHTIGDQW